MNNKLHLDTGFNKIQSSLMYINQIQIQKKIKKFSMHVFSKLKFHLILLDL